MVQSLIRKTEEVGDQSCDPWISTTPLPLQVKKTSTERAGTKVFNAEIVLYQSEASEYPFLSKNIWYCYMPHTAQKLKKNKKHCLTEAVLKQTHILDF